MKCYVKLFKDGCSFGVETNADDEAEFTACFSAELAEALGHYQGDDEFQIHGWLPKYLEICCRLRGYKADVIERRVILSGWDQAPESALVNKREPKPSLIQTIGDAISGEAVGGSLIPPLTGRMT